MFYFLELHLIVGQILLVKLTPNCRLMRLQIEGDVCLFKP